MNSNFSRGFSNLFKRDWIKKDEGKLTFIQFFGFLLITLGVIYLTSFLLRMGFSTAMSTDNPDVYPSPNGIAIAFFTTMLGLAFAFPGMLKGQTKDISTMRIIVFMFANVICMLLLKIGWDKPSLKDIGLDGFWMGVIAFLFGAKSAQTYFENAKSFIAVQKSTTSDTDLSKAEISRLAVIQNSDELLARYPNIECVSDTLKDRESSVAIYVRDNQIGQIPKELTAKLKNGSSINVPTEIVAESGRGRPQIGQATDELSDSNSPDFYGSICCIVESTTNPDFRGVVTSGHVFTYGDYYNYGGVLSPNNRRDVRINNIPNARLFFQQMIFNQDIAIAEIIEKSNMLNNYTSFSNGYYIVSESDYNSKAPNATVLSRQNNRRDAFILDFNVTFEINYFNSARYIRNIVLIGSTNDRNTSQTVSHGGDSGSCVYHKASGKLIGMLLGGNNKFSFVLPLQETLSSFNFKPL
jgi:hypothetical protein